MSFYNVVLICPCFHDYEHKMLSGLIKKGLSVKYVFYQEGDFFKLGLLPKFFLKILRFILVIFGYDYLSNKLYGYLKDYFTITSCQDGFNSYINNELFGVHAHTLIVIKGFGLSEDTLSKLSVKRKVLYQWDSLVRFPSIKNIYSIFDSIFTFDKKDAENGFGNYLPNFYVLNENKNEIRHEEKINLFFVGAHTNEREKVIEHLDLLCKRKGLTCFFYLYKRKKTIFRIYPHKDSYFIYDKPMPRGDYERFFSRSECIVEISHNGQYGSTQRVLEALAQGKMVLTNKLSMNNAINGLFSINEFEKWSNMEYISFVQNNKNYEMEGDISKYELNSWLDILLLS